MTETLAFFNNKGGVGKTTLACNFAHFAATSCGLTTALIDLDPQSNSTQLLLDEQQWRNVYETDSAKGDATVYRAFRAILEGDSAVNTEVVAIHSDRFEIDVVPGHPSLSRVEDFLSRGWIDFQGSQVGGARKSNWLATLRESLNYDLVVVDLGPSLGALNRSALVACTNLMTPVAADLFSLYALENIGQWISSWIVEYSESMERTIQKNPQSEVLLSLLPAPTISRGYVGYTVQQYVARSSHGKLRPTEAYDRYKRQIPERLTELQTMAPEIPLESLDLGTVPNMFSMVSLAQNAHAPISALTSNDGVRGAQIYQRDRYVEQLVAIFWNLVKNMGVGVNG